jgi:hypothetical protein
MITPPPAAEVPLRMDDAGVIRIGTTRVTLQALVADFHRGASPEAIALHYSALKLSDVYLVVGSYLQHRAEVDAYMRQLADGARRAYEADHPDDPFRAPVLARRRTAGADARVIRCSINAPYLHADTPSRSPVMEDRLSRSPDEDGSRDRTIGRRTRANPPCSRI